MEWSEVNLHHVNNKGYVIGCAHFIDLCGLTQSTMSKATHNCKQEKTLLSTMMQPPFGG